MKMTAEQYKQLEGIVEEDFLDVALNMATLTADFYNQLIDNGLSETAATAMISRYMVAHVTMDVSKVDRLKKVYSDLATFVGAIYNAASIVGLNDKQATILCESLEV